MLLDMVGRFVISFSWNFKSDRVVSWFLMVVSLDMPVYIRESIKSFLFVDEDEVTFHMVITSMREIWQCRVFLLWSYGPEEQVLE